VDCKRFQRDATASSTGSTSSFIQIQLELLDITMQSEIEGQTEGQTDQSQNTIQRSCRDHPACSDYLERKKHWL